MSIESLMEASEDLLSLEQIGAGIETDNTLIFEEIKRKLEPYFLGEKDNTNLIDGVSDFLIS